MSTTLDEARKRVELVAREAAVKEAAFEQRVREIAREEIARSRAPVGEDGALERMFASTPVRAQGDVADNGSDQRYAPFKPVDLGDGMGKAYVYEPTPPAKDTGEGEPRGCPTPGACSAAATIADLEQRLAEALDSRKKWNERAATAEIERDEARSSLETAERRIGEAVKHLREIESDPNHHPIDYAMNALAALTPDAGTARPEDEEGE